jgi:3-phytase
MRFFYFLALGMALFCCKPKQNATTSNADSAQPIKPAIISDPVKYDSDDPAIWINPQDASKSLIIGTDKGGDTGDGALFVFDIKGKEVKEKTVRNIKRPNNVDVAYGLKTGGQLVDIAVCTERNTNMIRIFSLPEMEAIDNGGIPVFETDSSKAPMGIALYTSPDKKIYAVVGRKTGKSGSYLWQYLLEGNENGTVTGKCVRKFGTYSGKHEIEAIAIDNDLGYIYYSDEGTGIRKYYAHPDSSNIELALFGTTGFADNHEGISIYKSSDSTGFILVSDQQANQFQVFAREKEKELPHQHPLLRIVKLSTVESDGNEVTHISLPGFPIGVMIAMSDDKTFQFYDWRDIADQLSNPDPKK